MCLRANSDAFPLETIANTTCVECYRLSAIVLVSKGSDWPISHSISLMNGGEGGPAAMPYLTFKDEVSPLTVFLEI